MIAMSVQRNPSDLSIKPHRRFKIPKKPLCFSITRSLIQRVPSLVNLPPHQLWYSHPFNSPSDTYSCLIPSHPFTMPPSPLRFSPILPPSFQIQDTSVCVNLLSTKSFEGCEQKNYKNIQQLGFAGRHRPNY